MKFRCLLITLFLLTLSGCWNGGNTHVQLGDVSVGQQLIDLKAALDEGAITQEEFVQTKATLLALNALCENTEAVAESESETEPGIRWF